MKKRNIMMWTVAAMLCCGTSSAYGQDWKSILSSVAKGVTNAVSGNSISAATLIGTWNYTAPDCKFKSDNLLAKAGGEIASKKVEDKMTEICGKLGLADATCSFTFNEDGTYAQTLNNKKFSGTYTFNEEDNTLTLTTQLGISFTANATLKGSNLSLLFNADKLLALLKTTAGFLSKTSSNTALSALTTLSGQYDGLMLGFELVKQGK